MLLLDPFFVFFLFLPLWRAIRSEIQRFGRESARAEVGQTKVASVRLRTLQKGTPKRDLLRSLKLSLAGPSRRSRQKTVAKDGPPTSLVTAYSSGI